MKILVVDDNEQILRLYKEELEEEGYKVITASTGKKALKLFEERNPDIVTLDILMPDIDGKKVLKKMKEQRRGTPVIMYTAYDYQNDFELLASESDAYLIKSSDLGELKKTIGKITRRVNKEKNSGNA